jgi:hypothetical protein
MVTVSKILGLDDTRCLESRLIVWHDYCALESQFEQGKVQSAYVDRNTAIIWRVGPQMRYR